MPVVNVAPGLVRVVSYAPAGEPYPFAPQPGVTPEEVEALASALCIDVDALPPGVRRHFKPATR